MAVGTPTITAPGAPTARDEAMFMADPRGFCAARISEVGPVFATGAFGGAVFVGGAEAVESVCAAGTPIASGGQRQPLELAPFAPLLASAGGDWRGAYESLCAAGFHEELYAGLFAWVPKFKETGGFSTFRFEDFIDPRVRKALPGARRLLFRATAPSLLGSTLEALPPREGLSTVREWGKAYAALASDRLAPASRLSLLGQAAGLSLPARLPGLGGGGGGEKGALLAAALGEGRLADALDAVEPTAALVTSMLAMAERQGGWSARLAAEQKAALTGAGPEAPIDAAAAGGVSLPAGTVVAAEPFVGHFLPADYASPDSFDPERFLGAGGGPPPSLGLCGPAGEAGEASRQLALAVAKATFVQLRRMFEIGVALDAPPPGGYPLHALPDSVDLKAVANMYYELQRGAAKTSSGLFYEKD
ncbi:hypothetical protein EMIHUDRAFT_454206 [Emiliania huxleyi CCMP1516]|uniref:Uncharacterized protein n=2 Tax=Emiliania huxleyi TaxID=2903 RepID=A0A0D3KXK6_EMIH1|nr:hypothetical protein EMIHUDRAFT_453588 [Emiliania huxleyi CCMP1516]XP_005792920.1 hypothetical protein EMIHUDRAFT_454206 [Emiliania huxleyi CCMP1516]EOD05983.1 hypothetical protein EMIHUDRAFT_453588 [Emiliania huxleyi CCMP1516]EOD40491.1 hypothetical protein EMIHUDRAFT_454206 [Emiliania huxleyi CCMP1516]|eukprot:XP_005758412.1 hypothetical protein EMIHUDRAFT_453588 [Emiliania huxleyi CCMP1516]